MIIHNAHFYIDGSFENNIKAIKAERGMITQLLEHVPTRLDEAIDLHGGYAYPGFIDCHTHSISGGIYTLGVDLSGCPDIASLKAQISRYAQKQEPGALIFAWNFDEGSLAEKRFPSQAEIDELCPDQLLLLRRIDGHSCMLSSNARARITALKSKDAILTGAENDLVTNWFHAQLDDEAVMSAYHSAAKVAMQGGFTTVHTMIGDAEMSIDHFTMLQERLDELPIEYILYPQSFNIDAALEAGSPRIGGCILADGSIGSHTAALSRPYRDKASCGTLYKTDEFWRTFIARAHENNLQVAIHCIGDSAIRQVNDVYLELQQTNPKDLRHQLIHCELCPDELIGQIKASQAVPVMQSAFDLYWGNPGGFYEQRLGAARLRQMNRFASLIRSEIPVCGSSDWYVTPMNIAMSIHAMIHHHNPLERISAQDAIKTYTENSARLSHDEMRLGKLQHGFQADLSVLNTDLTKPFDYQAVRTKYIVKKGMQVYAYTPNCP